MADTPLVSVIIPVYKTEKYLRGSVASVQAQTFTDYEIILVDDGSPDNCPAICDELAVEDGRIKVVHKQNGGLSSARNAGLDAASGRFVFFLDSDDTIIPDALQSVVTLMGDDVDAVICVKFNKVYEADGAVKECRQFPDEYKISDPEEYTCKVILGLGRAWRSCVNLYRRELIGDDIRFPLGHTGEDVFFNLKYAERMRRAAFCDKPILQYLQRAGSITASYNPKYIDTIELLDTSACRFANSCTRVPDAIEYANSLYMRTVILYATTTLSDMNPQPAKERRAAAKKLLYSARMKQAAKNYNSLPYFENRAYSLYMRIMYTLLHLGFKRTAYLTARISAKMIKGQG